MTTCPIACSQNMALLVSAGFLLEKQIGSLNMAKYLFLLFFSSFATQHMKTLLPADEAKLHKFPGLHSVSIGVALIYAMRMLPNRQMAMLLLAGVFSADLLLFRGLTAAGYLPAGVVALLI